MESAQLRYEELYLHHMLEVALRILSIHMKQLSALRYFLRDPVD
jgi:hypothetical protein